MRKSSEIGSIHVEHFDSLFTDGVLTSVVANTPPVVCCNFKLVFERLEVQKPYMAASARTGQMDRRLLPRDCREGSLSYVGASFLKLKLFFRGQLVFDDFKPAGGFPVMVGSQLCHAGNGEAKRTVGEDPNETGGYFIIGGYDRLVRFHIAYRRNQLFVLKTKQKDPQYSEYSCMIRSVGRDELGQKNEVKLCNDGNVHIRLYYRKRAYSLPAVLVLRSLVETTDREIYESLGGDQRVLSLLARETGEIHRGSRKESLLFLGTRFKNVLRIQDAEECGREFLRRVLFVHLDRPEDKYALLVEAVRKLFLASDGRIVPDDIDLPSNHEVYTERQLFALCLREKLEEIKRAFVSRIYAAVRAQVQTTDATTDSLNGSTMSELQDVLSEERANQVIKAFGLLDFSIGAKLQKFLSTGTITTISCSDLLQTAGFTLIAERINYWRFASHFESISRGAYFTTVKISRVRKLRPETWGFICPVNTPDGTSCGILLHLARGCHVRSCQGKFSPEMLYEYGLIPYTRGARPNEGVPCFFNGRLSGWTSNPSSFVQALRRHRSLSGVSVEICFEEGIGMDKAIYISDSPGAFMRRVLNLETGREDWIGIREQVFADIKLAPYTATDMFHRGCDIQPDSKNAYREMDNTLMLSIIGASIPFANHNPSPRNIYQCQMAKQAMGIPAFNLHRRTDNKSYLLSYLQSPMVRAVGYATLEPFPIGFNCIVAVLSYTAYDMEDAVVINRSAQERGLFNAFVYKCEKFVLDRHSQVEFTPPIGSTITPGAVLIRYSNDETGGGVHKYEGTESGIIDTVRLYDYGSPSVAITIRIQRNPTIGDKFCSRHGQKGVMSALWDEVDMPFTEQGIRPDIIVNPHAFPSRMTIAMLLESMSAKSALYTGETVDATPFRGEHFFSETAPGSIGDQLRALGLNFYGNEPMYSGVTGTEFSTDIFIGPVFYQRLRHMVNDKFQVRTSGPVVSTTRQPVGGRKNKGGMRFGEMERDALIAHGGSFLLKDRLLDCSDRTDFLCCQACGSVLFVSSGRCSCGPSTLRSIELPYVFKYLCCELLAMNIRVRIDVGSSP